MRFIDVDPNLSDFSDSELKDAAIAISCHIEDLEKMIEGYKKYLTVQAMFSDDIKAHEAKIENLQTVFTQLVNALAQKEHKKTCRK